MNNILIEQAEILATEPYTVVIMHDKTTTGEDIYLVSHPELPGCMAQGQSIAEAIDNLADATKEYIMSLLEDGLPVPPPMIRSTVTNVGQSETHEDTYAGHSGQNLVDDLCDNVQRSRESHIVTVALVDTS